MKILPGRICLIFLLALQAACDRQASREDAAVEPATAPAQRPEGPAQTPQRPRGSRDALRDALARFKGATAVDPAAGAGIAGAIQDLPADQLFSELADAELTPAAREALAAIFSDEMVRRSEAKAGIDAVVKWMPAGSARQHALFRLFRGLKGIKPDELLQRYRQLPFAEDQFSIANALQLDGPIKNPSPGDLVPAIRMAKDRAELGILARSSPWAVRAPGAGLEDLDAWIGMFRDNMRDQADFGYVQESLVNSFIQRFPRDGFTFALERDLVDKLGTTLEGNLQRLVEAEGLTGVELVASQWKDDPRQEMPRRLASKAVLQWLKLDMAAATAWIEALPETGLRTAAAGVLVGYLEDINEPDAAKAWARKLGQAQ
jgi:hypothetical protein